MYLFIYDIFIIVIKLNIVVLYRKKGDLLVGKFGIRFTIHD